MVRGEADTRAGLGVALSFLLVSLLSLFGPASAATAANCSAGLGTMPATTYLSERLLFDGLNNYMKLCTGLASGITISVPQLQGDGTIISFPAINSAVPPRDAIAMNGDVSSFVPIGDDVLAFINDDFAITLWFSPSATFRDTTSLIAARETEAFSNYISIRVVNGQVVFEVCQDAAGASYASITGGSGMGATQLSPAPWYHVAAVHKGNSYYLYINGQLVGSTSVQTPANIQGVHGILGGDMTNTQVGNTNGMAGQMDDVRIYRGALEAADVWSVYISWHSAYNSITAFAFTGINVVDDPGSTSSLRLDYRMQYPTTYDFSSSSSNASSNGLTPVRTDFSTSPTEQTVTLKYSYPDTLCDLSGSYGVTFTPTCAAPCPPLPTFTIAAQIDSSLIGCPASRQQAATIPSPTISVFQTPTPANSLNYPGTYPTFMVLFISPTQSVSEIIIQNASVINTSRQPSDPWYSRALVSNYTLTTLGTALSFPATLSITNGALAVPVTSFSTVPPFSPTFFINFGTNPTDSLLQLGTDETQTLDIILNLVLKIYWDSTTPRDWYSPVPQRRRMGKRDNVGEEGKEGTVSVEGRIRIAPLDKTKEREEEWEEVEGMEEMREAELVEQGET